jgi:osmotically inducible protein OsmC
MASRDATTRWTGNLQKGTGKVSLDSSNLGEIDVSFPTRFQSPDGQTSPEELIAAAQSSCLAMNLSGVLAGADLEAEYIDVSAEVTVGPDPSGGTGITGIAITLRAKLPGVDAERFAELAATAKETCPVSKALAGTTITMDAALD